MKHEYFFEVRGYELDSLGHVNNSVYLNYLEEARWRFLREMDWLDYLGSQNLVPVIIETKIRYLYELRMFDKAVVKTDWQRKGETLITTQSIYREDNAQKVTKAVAKLVLVSPERVIYELPAFMKEALPEAEY